MENDAVPLTAFTVNFSSMPFIAPPPFGREIDGICFQELRRRVVLRLIFHPLINYIR